MFKRKRNGNGILVSLNAGDEVFTDDCSIASSLNSSVFLNCIYRGTCEPARLLCLPSVESTISVKLDLILLHF